MRRRAPALVIAVLAVLALPALAMAAGCVCADRDGCSVDGACAGGIPGDTCGGGGKSTCRITLGTSADPTCCCTCGRGPGPRSCVFAPVMERAQALPATVDCGAAARRAVASAVEDLGIRLARAEAQCRRGARNAARLVDAARRRLERLRRKLGRLVERGKTTAACATGLATAVDALDADIDDIAARGMPGGGPVTTTTLPGTTPSCGGTLTVAAGAFALDLAFDCPSGPTLLDAFGVLVPNRHQITAFTAPPGFACTIETWTTANDLWSCTGGFAPDTTVSGGQIVLDPAPVAGMTASLYVWQGPARFGPFPLGDPRP